METYNAKSFKKIIPSEEQEQIALVQWCTWRSYPYNLGFAIPNAGLHHVNYRVKLKKLGLKSGIPDLLWPVARGGYYGLWIEMKREKGGTLSAPQKEMIEVLRKEFYRVEVCAGFEAAKAVLEEYFWNDEK